MNSMKGSSVESIRLRDFPHLSLGHDNFFSVNICLTICDDNPGRSPTPVGNFGLDNRGRGHSPGAEVCKSYEYVLDLRKADVCGVWGFLFMFVFL